ncbi:glycosyltransferase family 2 protein [Kushneria sp. Sum13]|uniref:glycosyltransferase family 2 protein n=1 Tax=Kushneria sp. Sum13 TaxID=3459196 RepID=UPI0040457604
MSLPPMPDIDNNALDVRAIVVTYHPDEPLLARLLTALSRQVSAGVIVNNGEPLSLDASFIKRCGFTVLQMDSNVGIASALNQGITWAIDAGASYVAFFDQDSLPVDGMITTLRTTLLALQARGLSPGAVGPCYEDRRTGKLAEVMAADTQQCLKMMAPPTEGYAEVDMLITSGCLIPVSVLGHVGNMKEDLFIDHVDMEWCFRARHYGYKIYIVGDTRLEHCIGDRFLHFMTRRVIMHSPVRHYYMIRNGIALQRFPHMTSRWRRNISLTIAKQFIFYSLFFPQRKSRIPLMLKGIVDGFRGHLGPLSQNTRKDRR